MGKTALKKRAAAHVASWIAYLPEDHALEVDELLILLEKYLGKLGRLVPCRLWEILPQVQAVVQRLKADQMSEARVQQAGCQLQRRLQRFRCCQEMEKSVVQSWQGCSERRATSCPKVVDASLVERSTQHAPNQNRQRHQLFRGINEWGLFDAAERLARLKRLEEAATRIRQSCNQTELAETICLVAAALSAPRQHPLPRDQDEVQGFVKPQPDGPNPEKDVQRRIRALLLDVLAAWRTHQFESSSILCVLEYVQTKITKFEDSLGEISNAAAGTVWLSIKQTVEDLFQQNHGWQPSHSQSCFSRASEKQLDDANASVERGGHDQTAETRRGVLRGFRRLDRQSGIPGISWNRSKLCWVLELRNAGRRTTANFYIVRLLKQGVDEDKAVDTALQKAKEQREEWIRQGKLQLKRNSTDRFSSVPGVFYDKEKQKWRARLSDPATKKKQDGGYFMVQAEAEAKAQEMAQMFDKQEEVVQVLKVSELPRFEPLGPQKGVRWSLGEQCWHAKCPVNGKTKNMRFRVKDFSDEEVKAAWEEAVAWRKTQEQQLAQSNC